jgi:hypothetical protein
VKLNFQILSSGEKPFSVEFWREEDNLYSKCTCPVSPKYRFCTHALSLILGNYMMLASKNAGDLKELKKMVGGSKDEELFNLIKKSLQATNFINERLSLTVKKDARTKLSLVDSYKILKDGGFGKGNGSENYLNVFDKNNIYVGSVKLKSSIYEDELKVSFYNLPIKRLERVDHLLYKGSASFYYFMENSPFNQLLQEESMMDKYKEMLKNV